MKNLPKEKRDRLISIAIGTVMAIAAVWFGLISTQKKVLARTAQQTVDQENKVAAAQRLVNQTAELEKELETKSAQLAEIEKGMASGDLYSWIILTVSQFSAERNVDIPQFSRETPAEVGMFPEFPYKAAVFDLHGQAYYHDLGKFVADFENAFPYFRIQNLELEPAAATSAGSGRSSEQTESSEKLSFRMEVVALVKPNAS